MSLALILIIIALGLGFLFVEVFLIPGTSVLAILGFVVIIIGVYLGYREFGQTTGNLLTVFSIVGAGLTMYIGYKRVQSKKWGLHTVVDGKVNVHDFSEYEVGEEGVAASDIRPEGKASFSNDRRVNVYSMGEFIDAGTAIVIVRIQHNKIYVKPLNT
ncbi:MAG TPA: NfeD family protein [Chitinophagales bacterium]|nr:NfeD family protein [Chitinophagales bacterium]HQU39727.1 NfeD family protein [Chitinophagales bacterium]